VIPAGLVNRIQAFPKKPASLVAEGYWRIEELKTIVLGVAMVFPKTISGDTLAAVEGCSTSQPKRLILPEPDVCISVPL